MEKLDIRKLLADKDNYETFKALDSSKFNHSSLKYLNKDALDCLTEMRYLRELLNQYVAATGSRKVTIDELFKNSMLSSEFCDWLIDRKNAGKELKKSSLYGLSSTAEFGKGPLDTVVDKERTTIISPLAGAFGSKPHNKLITGNLVFKNGRPFIDKEDRFGVPTDKVITKIQPGIDTLMTENPYDFKTLDGLENLHNYGRSRVVVSVFGRSEDHDREKKLKELREFAKLLTLSPYARWYAFYEEGSTKDGKIWYGTVMSKPHNDTTRMTYGEKELARLKKVKKM